MCDENKFEKDRQEYVRRGLVTRKQFGVMLGAGIAMMLPKVANAQDVTESEVMIETPDGMADAFFVHPASGAAPGVLMWPDIFGLRPAFRDMGRRLAQSGYSVLVPNPFYRLQPAPTAPQGAGTPINVVLPHMQSLSEETHMADARTFVDWLDEQDSVAGDRMMGTQGYCMGGPMAFRTAAARSNRVGAVASFHGGGLVAQGATSPHTQAARSNARFLVAIAENDDQSRPDEKNVLRATFAQAGLQAEIEVYEGSAHGWCPPDSGVYNEPSAERAWSRLLDLYSNL